MTSSDDDLKARAKQHIQQLPAETALGNADPTAGGEGDPKDFLGNSDVPLPE